MITIFLLLGRHHYWLAFGLAAIPGAAGFAVIQEWRWQLRVAQLLADPVISYEDFDKSTKYCLLARPFYLEEKAEPAPATYGMPPGYLWDVPATVPLVERLVSRIQVIGLQNRRAVRRLANVRIVTCEDTQWESAFEVLARQAVVVVVDPELLSPGIKRELEILTAIDARSKAVFMSNSGNDPSPPQFSTYSAEGFKWNVSIDSADGGLTERTIGDIQNFIDLALAHTPRQ